MPGKDEPPLDFETIQGAEEALFARSRARTALCLSGGGIRSATFSQGVLQGLARAGVLGDFDYLSTVSGGGYTGAWLTCWMYRMGGVSAPAKGLREGPEKEGAEPLRYLRANSQYLRESPSSAAPGAGTLVGLYGQKTALTLFLMLPVLASMVLAPSLFDLFMLARLPELEVLGVGVALAAYVQVAAANRSLRQSDRRNFSLVSFLVAEAGCALISVTLAENPFWMGAVCYGAAAVLAWAFLRFRWRVVVALIASAGTQLLCVPVLTRISMESLSYAALWIGLAALLGRAATNAVLCALLGRLDPRADVSWAAVARARLMTFVLFLAAMYTIAVWLPRVWLQVPVELTVVAAAAVIVSAAVFAALVYRSVEVNFRDKRTGKLPLPLAVVFQIAGLVTIVGLVASIGAWVNAHLHGWDLMGYVIIPLMIAPLAAGFFVDANSLSLHDMYRAGLVRAFLGASRVRDPDPLTNLDRNDDLPLTLAAQRPFPVICAARKNIGPLRDTPFHRTTESFIFTPLHCGSLNLGYRRAAEYGGGIQLGTAIAASGAAVSPNLAEGSGYVALLRTILSPHLGIWLPNPAGRWWRSARPLLAQSVLLKDLTGAGSSADPFIWVSDGGHFENLGLYEMVRRKCRFVVLVDAARDVTGSGDDLANAISRIRTDLHVDIELNHSPRSHFSVGFIRYRGAAQDGVLLYIKPVLTGDEPAEVTNYAALNREFPQESTADQFFTEAQFESYRLLGLHSLSAAPASSNEQSVEELIQLLS